MLPFTVTPDYLCFPYPQILNCLCGHCWPAWAILPLRLSELVVTHWLRFFNLISGLACGCRPKPAATNVLILTTMLIVMSTYRYNSKSFVQWLLITFELQSTRKWRFGAKRVQILFRPNHIYPFNAFNLPLLLVYTSTHFLPRANFNLVFWVIFLYFARL